MLPVADDDLDRIARQLPKGRVFASGKAFVPFVGQGLYDKLAERLPTSALTKPPRATPLDGASVAAGAGKGSPAAPATPKGPAAPVAPAAKNEASTAVPGASLDPADAWSKIKAGDVVLALDASEGGWFEANVVEIADDEFLKLRWRDYPEEAHFLRRRWNVGLLHPRHGRP